MSSLAAQLHRSARTSQGNLELADFAGGLNRRDALMQLAPNETPEGWNFTCDEVGGAIGRLGYTRWNASAAANLFTYTFYSKLLGLLFWYSKADGKLYSDPGTGVLTLRKTFTAGSDVELADFVGKTYANHPVDGLFQSSDGTTWTATVAASGSVPKGSLLRVWQNKLWSAGDPANVTNLSWCGPGDATKWASADGGGNVNLRDKDDAPIVCLFGGSGVDYQNAPSLLVFKEESFYRVIDSSTGEYRSLDGKVGAASYKSVVTLYGEIYFLSKRGIYQTDGVSGARPAGPKLAALKVAPFFTAETLNYGKQANFCAGYRGDRIFFSVTRAGSTVNDLAFEFHPLLGWTAAGSNAMACYVTYGANDEQLLGASPTVTGRAYKLQSGGTDDGTAITSWFVTRPFELAGSNGAILQRCRINGRGPVTVSYLPDFATSGPGESLTLAPSSGAVWDTDVWDDGVFADNPSQGYATSEPHLPCRAVQVRIDASTSTASTAPPLLETGVAPAVGGWALYGLDLQFTPLGYS